MGRRPVESREIPARCRDPTRSSVQKLHLIWPALGGDEDGLGRGNLRHLRRVEMCERCDVVDALHVQTVRALTKISNKFSCKLFASKLSHLLRQMLKVRLMVRRRRYLRVRLVQKVMAIEIAGLSKWLRVNAVHLALRRQMRGWS